MAFNFTNNQTNLLLGTQIRQNSMVADDQKWPAACRFWDVARKFAVNEEKSFR